MKAESLPLTLEVVEAKFSDWRRTRKKLAAPLSLKQQTVGLLLKHSKSQVLSRLKINHAMLKRWQRELAIVEKPPSDFVSLPGSDIASTHEERTRLTVTRRRHDGETLSIEGELTETQWRWALVFLSEKF